MAWNYQESKTRLSEEWKRLEKADFTVKKLTREMDLSNLGLTESRLVHGVHLYANIANFSAILDDPLLRRDDSKRLHRYLHVIRVEQRRIMQSVFDGDKIQVQGPKFHGLLYKPYDDDSDLAWNSVLAGIVLHCLLTRATPQVFETYPILDSVIGLDLGDVVVANIGLRGDRELISVGSPANHAAKIHGDANSLTVGKRIYDCLSKTQRAFFVEDGDVYRMRPGSLQHPESLIEEAGFDWSIDSSVNHMAEVRDALPLDEIVIQEARERIDPQLLGPRRAKICDGVSVFVDIDGYTKCIDALAETGDLEKLTLAVKWLHLFRYEVRHVTECDFDGVTIQYQGDRLQAFLHTPAGNDGRIIRKAVEACISYDSSVEDVLNVEHNLLGQLHVSIGCDFGKTLVSRSGVIGDLDVTCLGRSAQNAEEIQLRMKGQEIGLESRIYDAILDESVKDKFSFDKTRDCYVGKEVTWTSVEDAERAKQYNVSTKAAYTTAGTIAIGSKISEGARNLKVTRPWSE
jgi:class 3 adenylate cyclase